MENRHQKENSELYFKMKKVLSVLTTAYYGIYAVAFIAALTGYYILFNHFVIDKLTQPGISISSVLIIYIIGSVPLSLGWFNSYLKKLKAEENPEVKLLKYRKAALIRLIIIGTGLTLGILFFYILQSRSMIFCAGIAAIALVFCKPSEIKIITDLNLENEDI